MCHLEVLPTMGFIEGGLKIDKQREDSKCILSTKERYLHLHNHRVPSGSAKVKVGGLQMYLCMKEGLHNHRGLKYSPERHICSKCLLMRELFNIYKPFAATGSASATRRRHQKEAELEAGR